MTPREPKKKRHAEVEGNYGAKKPRKDPPKPSEHAVIVSYEDNYDAKIALHSYHSIQQELATKLREALLLPLTPLYQLERAILLKNRRILINCQNEITRTFVKKVVHDYIWQGPEGPRKFKAWKAEEAPEGSGLVKVTTRIFGPRRSFSEFIQILNKQNPGLNISDWKDLNNGDPEEGSDYSQSHIIYIGLDTSSLELLKTKSNTLYYLDRVISIREFVSKKTGENVTEEAGGMKGDADKEIPQVHAP